MIPTIFGVMVLVIGSLLLMRPPAVMLGFAIICLLLSGSAALYLPALGGSSVPPATLALAFLALRMLKENLLRSPALLSAIQTNSWLLFFCIYGAATGFTLPKIFAGQVYLIPMGAAHLGPQPLHASSQNVTTAIYLLGTGFGALAAGVLARKDTAVRTVADAFVLLAALHIGTGILDLALHAVHQDYLLDYVRNGSYSQLDQQLGAVHRIAGVTPEPSVYATLGGALLVLMCEFWLRNYRPRLTSFLAVAMVLMLALTTSSTGYIYLGTYGLVLWARLLFVFHGKGFRKTLQLGLFTLFGVCFVIGAMALKPHFAAEALDILKSMTLSKSHSSSGIERSNWARQGLIALKATHGIGVGVGSFRSSSLITAILGAVGPVGLVAFLGYVAHVAKLFRRSTYQLRDDRAGLGASLGWAALISVVPACFTAPTPDPGLLFAIMAGTALVWRAPEARSHTRAANDPVRKAASSPSSAPVTS